MFRVDPDETASLAAASGLHLIRQRETASLHPGNQAMNVRWTWLAFENLD